MISDAHTHIDFYDDIDKVVKIIKENDIYSICCSMDEESFLAQQKLEDDKRLIKCFGIHPFRVKGRIDIERFDEYIKNTPMIAEIGLDFHWVKEKETYPHQVQVFEDMLKKAVKYDKFINIHTKGAESEIVEFLKRYNTGTIVHWYSGDIENLKKLIDMDCYFTVSVDCGYSEITDEIIRMVPENRLLIETDGAGSMEWIDSSKKSSPLLVNDIAGYISKFKGIKRDELEEIVNGNFFRTLE